MSGPVMRVLRTAAEKAAAKALWLEVFPEDGDGFCDWYFANRFDTDTYYGLFEAERLCSMVGVGQPEIRLFDTPVRVGMLRGVATHPELQGRGYAGKLLAYVAVQLKEQGLPAVLLKTFIHPFYERLGYVVCSYRGTVCYAAKAPAQPQAFRVYRAMEEITPELCKCILACYDAHCAGKPLYPYRDEASICKQIDAVVGLYDGVLITHQTDGRIDGYALCYYREDGGLESTETVGTPELVAQMAAATGCTELCRKEFAGEPDAMILVLDPQKWLAYGPADAVAAANARELSLGQMGAWLLNLGGQPGIFEEY